ncbi:glycoside hydrolase family 114 protein [Stipitochalara longipes BDJ]|nr:glycoside hydrolase family 114 protein [Stipitochalara longipes BDJ]
MSVASTTNSEHRTMVGDIFKIRILFGALTCKIGCNFGGEFPDEFWLNTTSLEVRRIMQTRIQYAKERGCSAIDPDNIDGYNNTNGIGLNPEDSVSFFKFLSTEAHSRGMGIGLKNSLDLIPHVLDDLDFAVNEQCLVFNTTSGISECTKYAPLFKLSTPVPVFNIEYPPEGKNWTKAEAEERCKETKALNLPYLHTNLKNYPTVDCGVSRCGGSGPAPGLDSKGKLPIPAGCVNSIATDDESEIAA